LQATSDSVSPPAAPAETLLFSATLYPHRSLGPAGTVVVIGLVGLIALVTAMPFVMMGAWPVGGFFGLDVFLLWLCFRLNNRAARRYEQVMLSRLELIVRKVSAGGEASERRFNPFFVRLRADKDPDFGLTRLAIVQRREEVEIGAFLAPFERADFAQVFGGALAKARG